MSSVIRAFKEPTPVAKRFTVFPYYGATESEYYFTCQNNSLYRIESDLIGQNQWVVARDMGKEMTITDIDIEIKEWWENQNLWENITVIRSGRARKYQALAIPYGNIDASYDNGPARNAATYMSSNLNIPYFNGQNMSGGINDLLQMGYDSTTVSTDYNQNLSFGTFWAVIDPVVIQYTFSEATYTRAIVNRVTNC
jgi:hypothetical protein